MIPPRRMLHSKIWQNDKFASLTPLERLLYIGMILLGDDEGRLRGDARFLKNQIFPYDKIDVSKIEKMRDKIHEQGLITVYLVENEPCIQHPKWSKYQSLRRDRCKVSDYPPPLSDMSLTSGCRVAAEGNVTKGNINKEKLTEAHPEPFSPRELMERGKKIAAEELAVPSLASSKLLGTVATLPHEVALLIDN